MSSSSNELRTGMADIVAELGHTDIYLLDQVMRGRIAPRDVIFDAGCGYGRNLTYFLRHRFTVFGADADPAAIGAVRQLAAELAPHVPPENLRAEALEALTFPAGMADVVISSAVLHLASDDAQFEAMLRGSWRVLRAGGVFFVRLASSIGFEDRVRATSGRRYRLPDGTDRYLVDEPLLMEWTQALGGRLLDPLKTTIVQDQRAMTTWVVRKD